MQSQWHGADGVDLLRMWVEMMIAFSGRIGHQFADFVFLVGVQAISRFIQHQHRRIVQQRLRQTNAALEAFRQRLDGLQADAFETGSGPMA